MAQIQGEYREIEVDMAPISNNLKKFQVYESNQQIMVIGSDKFQKEFHVLRFKKTLDTIACEKQIDDIMIEEIKTFDRLEIKQYIQQFKCTGQATCEHQDFKHIMDAFGVLGLVKFLKGFYLIMITQKKKVAKIGLHNVYQIKDMKMISLFTWSKSKTRFVEEQKYINLFQQIKIAEGFYFSYTYDLTHTLQMNIISKIKREEARAFDRAEDFRESEFYNAQEESSDSEADDPIPQETFNRQVIYPV